MAKKLGRDNPEIRRKVSPELYNRYLMQARKMGVSIGDLVLQVLSNAALNFRPENDTKK